jgi:hypothetical protein
MPSAYSPAYERTNLQVKPSTLPREAVSIQKNDLTSAIPIMREIHTRIRAANHRAIDRHCCQRPIHLALRQPSKE